MVTKDELGKKILRLKHFLSQTNEAAEQKLTSDLRTLIELKEFTETNQHDRSPAVNESSNGTTAGQPGQPGQNTDGRTTITENDIFEGIYDLMIQIIRERPLNGRLIDTRHTLRSSCITLLKLLVNQVPQSQSDGDKGTPDRAKELILICFDVICSDSEEIAMECFEIIEFLVMERRIELIEIEDRVVAFAQQYLEFLSIVPEILRTDGVEALEKYQSSNSDIYVPAEIDEASRTQTQEITASAVLAQPDNFQEAVFYPTSQFTWNGGFSNLNQAPKSFKVYGNKSLQNGSDFIRRLLEKQWRTRAVDQQPQSLRVINSVKDEVFKLLQQLSNQNRLPKSSPPFLQFLANIIELMTDVTYLIKSDREYLSQKVNIFMTAFVVVARCISVSSCDLRRKHFQMFNNFVFYSNKLQLISNNQLFDQMAHNMDSLIDDRVLYSTGPISKSMIDVQVKYVFTFIFEHLKHRISPGQMASIVQIMMHWMLNPITSFTLKNHIATELYHIQKQFWERSRLDEVIYTSVDGFIQVTNMELQLEILYTMIKSVKHLRIQTEQGIEFFKKYPDGIIPQPEVSRRTYQDPTESQKCAKNLEKKYFDQHTNKVLPMENVFQLKESELVNANNESFENAWQNISETHDLQLAQQMQQGVISPPARILQEKKEYFLRNTKTFFLYIEKVLILMQQLNGKILDARIMKLMKRFVKHGFYLIYNLYELIPVEILKYKEICEIMKLILYRLKISQFRDLLISVGEDIFGLIVETKARGFEGGLLNMTKNLMEFKAADLIFNGILSDQPDKNKVIEQIAEQKAEQDFQAHFLEQFFYYLKQKIELFDHCTDDDKEAFVTVGLTPQEIRLSKISINQLQKAMQTFLLSIGEQTLRLSSDIRVKHTFFGVFTMFIQKIRSGYIVPQYFKIIRTLLKDICNSEELMQQDGQIKEIMRDFTPIFKGLLETFLQAKQEANYVKESNEICCLVPAKLKHLLDSLPAISHPLIHSMSPNQQEQTETGIQMIQYWLAALSPFPDLLNPVLKNVMPDLNKALINNITIFPSPSFKLMGKLGAKTRRYNYYNKNKPRNYSEDGLKICLKDRHSNNTITFGIDGVIDVILIRHLARPDAYQPSELMQAINFVKCAFLSYIDPNLNIDFILASIVASKNTKEMPGPSFFEQHGIKAPQLAFNAKDKQIFVKQMTRGSESHVFEKILRCLIFGCYSLPSTTPDHKKVQRKHTQFMKWVTRYFTLIYICKNGNLQSTMVDEINPILFIDYIDQFLYYNIQTQMYNTPDRPYFKGSVIAIKTMLRMLKELYGDTPEVFNNLEIIPVLIKKICQQVHDLPKTLAVNIAIQILIKELPTSCLKKNAMIILNTLFMIVNQSTGSVIKSVEKELQPTFEEFFKAIGCYDILVRVGGFDGLLKPKQHHRWQQHEMLANEEQLKNDYKLFTLVVDKILKNLLSLQKVSRSISVMFLEKIAQTNNVKVYQILQNIPYIDTSHVPRPAATANAEQPAVTYWAQYLHQNEVEKKVHDIIKMFKSGYTQVQSLISYIDILLFTLKHCDEKLVMDRKHIFILIADYLLLILEDESDLFERSCDKFKFMSGPNIALNRITKQYVKMERYYLNQNKDYDPYSNTMHSHQLLNKHFFEINMQAKEERIRVEISEMQERHKKQNLKLYDVQTANVPDELNEEALKELSTWERRSQVQEVVHKKILDYIQKLFGYQRDQNRPASKLQDISFEYMRSLYEMYPNVRIHSELIVACLKLLCNIVAHPELMQLFKARQKEFFTQMPSMQDHDIRFDQSSLKTAFDYFIVEIKAKIIGIVFKFFQRDEMIIQKQSKQCLKLLLSIEHSPNEALPNIILKEVIRPYLSQINANKSNDQNHQHLSKLIKILYSCFNDQLKMLLSSTLKQLQEIIMEDYIPQVQPQPIQPPAENQEVTATSDPALQQAQQVPNMQQQQPNELTYLVEQYNDKVLKISTAAGIINVLPLLIYQMQIQPSMREIDDIKKEYQEILLKTLQFQHFLIYEFERKFEDKLKTILLMDPNQKLKNIQDGYNTVYNRLSPLQTNVGHLKSDIKNGIAKLFNIQQDAAQECFKDPRHTQLFFEILNQSESYCLRERLSRDRELSQNDRLFREGNNRSIDNIRQNNNTEFTPKFVQFVNQAYTFSKFYPQYLQQKRNIKILDDLRFAWLKNTSSNSVLITQSREVYMKIQKCLVIYCKNEHSDTQILFDLLKEFFSPLSLDMSPLIQLCTIEIPQKASIERKISILNTTLDKIQTSQSSHEQKYTMFEFAFMPIMLQCANNSRRFHELFSKKLISKFIETFFFNQQRPSMFGQGPEQRETFLIWKNIRTELENGYKISYQNFFIEIVKVLSIFLRFVPSYKYFLECIPEQHEMPIINFLDWVGKNATDQSLKEHAFYTLSAFGVRKMNLDLPDWPEADNQGFRVARQSDMGCSPSMVIRRVENGIQVPVYQPHFVKKQFLDLLSQNVLAPLLETDHTKIKNIAIVENTFCNLHKVFSDPRIFQVTAEGNSNPELVRKLQQTDNGFWEFFKRRYSLKPALSSRLKLCNLVCKKEAICSTGEEVLDRRLIKTIKLFAQQNLSHSNFSQFKEPLEIIESLFQQAQVLLKKPLSREALSNLHSELTQFSAITFHIFWVRLIGLDPKTFKLMQQSGTKNDFIQFAEHCMHILRKIMALCSKPIGFQLDNLKCELPKEVYALKTIISMNLYSLSMSHEFQFSFNFRIMIDYLRESYLSLQEMEKMDQFVNQGIALNQAQAQAKHLVARSIAQNMQLPFQNALYQFGNNYNQLVIVQFPVHLITLTIKSRQSLFRAEQLAEFYFVLKQAIRSDVQNSNKRDIKNVQSCLVREYIRQQATEKVNLMRPNAQASSSNPTLINQQMVEDQKNIQLCIPNFAIRMIYKLEKLKEEGKITATEFDQLVDKSLYKDITQVLFKVISAFRQSISSEKQSLKPQAEKKPEVAKKEESDEDMSNDDDSDSDDLDLNKAVDFGSKARSVDGKTETYIDFEFPDNQLEFKPVEYSIDIWTKESIMIALKSIVIHMKSSLHQDEAFQLLEQVKIIMKWFQMFKTCEYLLQQLFEVTKLLVIDTPDQKIKLVANEKIAWLYKLLNTAKLKEISDARQVKDSLVNKVFDLCLDFLEQQISINAREGFIFLLDKLMLLKPTCSFALRKRIYRVFEKFHGSSLRAKLIYFFSKLTQDDHEKVIQQCQINNLLDFTLYNFQEDIPLHKVKDSSSLYRMSNNSIVIQGLDVLKASAQGKAIQGSLKWFTRKFEKYKNKQLNDLMKPLSEIIRINPEHSLGDNIAEKIFSKVFWQFWHFIERSDQQYLAEAFNKIFQNFIKLTSSLTPQIKSQFCKTLLEQVVALKEPQVRIEPEVLQYLSKHFNLWHVCIPQLEDHVLLFPNNERYVHSLQELYDRLMEEDLSAGLSRIVTKSPEIRTLITLGQHERWDQINQQFSQYINFYSEQEGFFSFLEGQQRMPGKYSRQITKTAICEMINRDEKSKSQFNQQQQEPPFVQILEEQDAKKLQSSTFPKAGSNRKISDIDLRMWETLYVKSLRILKRFDLYKDTLENMYNREMKIEYLWSIKNLPALEEQLSSILAGNNRSKKDTISENSIQRVKYHLYQNYVLGNQGHQREFDTNFRDTIKLAINQLCENLPLYMDRVHNEYHILFQLINESNEGGRNILMCNDMKRFSDFRNAMNIWRERLPHECESILVWQELLENRNFIFQKLKENILTQNLAQGSGKEKQSRGQEEDQIDIVWNNLKLAEISRKQELPQLSNHYLNQVKDVIKDPSSKGEILKLERFKFMYETFKLVTKYQTDSTKLKEVSLAALDFFKNPDYDLWMHAEILRLEGEFALNKGQLKSAKEKLLQSIDKNKKESKTWIAYGKLNELIFRQNDDLIELDIEAVNQQIRDEKSIQNALKGYFCGVTLNQSKSRLIIPYILNLLKTRSQSENKSLRKFVYLNIQQMPAWIWIFWMPQLLHFLKQTRQSLQQSTAHRIFTEKLCKLYPQATYYTLREKQRQIVNQRRTMPVRNPQDQVNPQEQIWQELIDKNQRTIKSKNSKQLEGMNEMIQELFLLSKVSTDDTFLVFLFNILNYSHQILMPNQQPIEAQLNKHLSQLYEKFLKKNHENELAAQTSQASKPQFQSDTACSQIIASEFYKHFIDKNTREKDFLQQMKLIKNFKDFMLIQKQLKDQQPQLQELSPNLVNFNTRGIELPGQYVLNTDEPRPENIKLIEKIKPVINRNGQNQNEKKIEFKCNDGKSYAFAILPFNSVKPENQFEKFLSDERATQLKVIINMMFDKHKESKRRGLKLYAAPKILVMGVRLVKDNLQFADFQSTHDYLLMERGLDPDIALLMHIEQVKDILEVQPVEKRQLSSIELEHVEQINYASYKHMVKEVEPFLLTSYFHRIFYNVDNMFIFKKQFTKFHAVNSFFAYAFNQSKFLSLNQLSFCKASGKINFTETELRQAQCPRGATANLEFEDIEAELFEMRQKQAVGQTQIDISNLNYLPFRLTPNFEAFIGQIGVQGLMAGVMTSASLAISSQQVNFAALLKLLFADEFQKESAVSDEVVNRTTEFCLFKILSLVNHERILDQPEKDKELRAQPLDPMRRDEIPGVSYKYENNSGDEGHFMIGQMKVPLEYFDLQMDRPNIPEEFNKKVFTLIEMANDDARRAQRHLSWCPWF